MRTLKRVLVLVICFIMTLTFLPLSIVARGLVVFSEESSGFDYKQLNVTFLNVGMGDCTYIKYKNIDVIIDSGERETNSEQGVLGWQGIIDYVKNAMGNYAQQDNVLDYVVATHSDSDHIGNMAKIIDAFSTDGYKIANIIDFDSVFYQAFYMARYEYDSYVKNKEVFNAFSNDMEPAIETADEDNVIESQSRQALRPYEQARDKARKNHGTQYYCVAERYAFSKTEKELDTNPLTKPTIMFNKNKTNLTYDFIHGDLKLRFLYNENYFELLTDEEMEKKVCGKDNMDYPYYANSKSVCLMVEYGDSKVLLTGDIEETHNMKAETELVNNFASASGAYKDLIKDVTLYKAAHHGSSTSNCKELIEYINPKYVGISANANSKSSTSYWNFPRQDVLNTIFEATKNVYVTAFDKDGVINSFYGNITFVLDKQENVDVKSSVKASDEKAGIYDEDGNLRGLMDTNWFDQNRNRLDVYTFSGYVNSNTAYIGNCTLLKYGSTEILIDCGVVASEGVGADTSDNFVKKIMDKCEDKVLEYVIVTSPRTESISQLADLFEKGQKKADGVFSSVSQVKKLIDFGETYDPSEGDVDSFFYRYQEAKNQLVNREKQKTKYYEVADLVKDEKTRKIKIDDWLTMTILKNQYYGNADKNCHDDSISLIVTFFGEKLLFMGDMSAKGERELINKNANELKGVSYFKTAKFSWDGVNTQELLDTIKNDNLHIVVSGIKGKSYVGSEMANKTLMERLLGTTSQDKIYVSCQYKDGKYENVCGDLCYTLRVRDGKISRVMN